MMFGRKCSIVGVVHVKALPGSHGYQGSVDRILSEALSDARKYKDGGVDAIVIENMHDVPYLRGGVEPETTATMSVIASQLRKEIDLPMGVQLLAGANTDSLAVAIASGLEFIRVEGFVFAHVGDEGWHESCAARLLRRRAALKAEHIKIFSDIKKKHAAHAVTSDVSLVETAHAAEFFKTDAVIVTGPQTGHAADLDEVKSVKGAVRVPVLVGSGVTIDNINKFARAADGLIVGSYFKKDGHWANPVETERVKRLMESVAGVIP